MPPPFLCPHPPTSLLLKRFRFLLLSKLVLRPPWQHDEMCLPHLFSFKTVVYENNVCSKRDGKSKQFAILIFLVQKFYLIKLRLPISVGVNICFKFPVSSTLPPHIIYSLANSDNIFLHLKKYISHPVVVQIIIWWASDLISLCQLWPEMRIGGRVGSS